jgi:recombination protein RecR
MDPFARLTDFFVRFPGVGSRQAKRFVYYLLTQDARTLDTFTELIREVKGTMNQCTHCYRYFHAGQRVDADLCSVCAYEQTDKTTMMIVEKDIDIDNVARCGEYFGRYFVLGALVPLVQKRTMPTIRIKELAQEIERAAKEDGLREIIFGLTVSPEGEHTRETILTEISDLLKRYNLSTTTLGRGLSTGTELEYSDGDTLKSALKNRF